MHQPGKGAEGDPAAHCLRRLQRVVITDVRNVVAAGQQLLACGDDIPDVGDDYTLQAPETVRGRVAFGALPWLMHDRPFVQGLTASAEIGSAMARAVSQQAAGRRRRLWYIE